MKLRERGIYITQNKQHFIASKQRHTTSRGDLILSITGDLGWFLFNRYDWAFHGKPDFEVSPNGSILSLAKNDAGRPKELIDTGATAGGH